MLASLKAIMHDKRSALVGTAASILIWWHFSGQHKYGTKGLRSYK